MPQLRGNEPILGLNNLSLSSFDIPFYRIVVGIILKFDMELPIHPSQIASIEPA
jgi:hypothetical protein